jgi:cell division protein FtsW (lipid II flippase)
MFKKNCLLLLPSMAILFLGTAVIELGKYPVINFSLWSYILAIAVGAFCIAGILQRTASDADPYIFPIAMFLGSIGLIMIERLKAALFIPQIHWILIGMTVFFGIVYFTKNIRFLVNYQYLIGLCCLLLLSSTFFIGTEIGGSRNWIVLGPFQVQPSEFAKIFIIVFLSAYLIDHKNVLSLPSNKFLGFRWPPLRFIAPLLLIWGIAVLMFVVQKDLGSALLFFGIAIFMTYMATGNKTYVFMALFFFIISSIISYQLFGHVRVRVAIWLHPWSDPNGMAYQVVQSLFAFGSGGIWGTGFSHGYPGLIPEVHTDFIFSAIAEELGLLGDVPVILVYVLLIYRGIRISLQCKNEMNVLLAAGLSISLALQVFIILAGVTTLLPLTGITLPFISYGGSSMLSSFIILGLLFILSKKENSNA